MLKVPSHPLPGTTNRLTWKLDKREPMDEDLCREKHFSLLCRS